ncbi:MAG: O-antigen ligase family protein [Deltaproteobacteria bacterium]|nr:O-antigen ligase family protein [Deltaproteobacteria bacterium]
MRPFAFVVLLAVTLYNLRLNPAWAAAAACYFYFAIPMREFNMPSAPYQAGFFAVAVVLSVQSRYYARAESKKEIIERTRTATREVLTALRGPIVTLITRLTTADERRSTPETCSEASREARADIARLVPLHAPKKLVEVVRDTVSSVCDQAISRAAAEAESVRTRHGGGPMHSRGVLEANVVRQVEASFNRELDIQTDRTLETTLEAAIAEYESSQHARPNELREYGILGVPLHRPALIAVLTNTGVWAHLAFTLATAICASHARWSQNAGEKQVELCWLLFIPILGIICGVRNAKQFRLYAAAWTLGVAHLCYNGVTWWLSHGGRADNVGGQQGDANWLGITAVSVAPVALAAFLSERNRWVAWAGLSLAGLCVLGVLAGGSRGALISLIIGVAYWFFWTNKKGIAAGLLLLGLAGFLFVAPASFWERMGTMFLPKTSNPYVVVELEESAQSRKRMWALAIQVFKEEPLLGIGPKNFPLENKVRGVALTADGAGLETHSTWLQLLAEFGLTGAPIWFLAYLTSLLCMLRAFLITRHLRGDPRYGWMPTYFLGFQAGWISNAVAASFVSCQWLDFNYWIFIFGPLALQIAKETKSYVEWFEVPGAPSEAPPAPRYGEPSAVGLDLTAIDLEDLPALRDEASS